jgi:hypothetical protein
MEMFLTPFISFYIQFLAMRLAMMIVFRYRVLSIIQTQKVQLMLMNLNSLRLKIKEPHFDSNWSECTLSRFPTTSD